MKQSKGLRISALLMAILLVGVAFAGAAALQKDFPEDSPVHVLMGLNDSQLQPWKSLISDRKSLKT